jgi:hypothetical protein
MKNITNPMMYSIMTCLFLTPLVYGQIFPGDINIMNESKIENIRILVSQFIATEENLQPLGINTQRDRDIGFASVFIRLENNINSNQVVTIQNLEVVNVNDGKLQPFDFRPQQIHLNPLEYATLDLHLTNKTGYVGQDKVKAIVTYQIGDQVNIAESAPVAIDRY